MIASIAFVAFIAFMAFKKSVERKEHGLTAHGAERIT